MLYESLTEAEIAAIERRSARVEQAFSDDAMLCEPCGIRMLDYHAAMNATDWTRPAAAAHAVEGTGPPPALACRHRNPGTECQVRERMRRMFDDPLQFPHR